MIDDRFVAAALNGQGSLFLYIDFVRSRLVEEEQINCLQTFFVRIDRPDYRFGQERVLIRKEDFGGLEIDFVRFTLPGDLRLAFFGRDSHFAAVLFVDELVFREQAVRDFASQFAVDRDVRDLLVARRFETAVRERAIRVAAHVVSGEDPLDRFDGGLCG